MGQALRHSAVWLEWMKFVYAGIILFHWIRILAVSANVVLPLMGMQNSLQPILRLAECIAKKKAISKEFS